jgi:hypothetical protein
VDDFRFALPFKILLVKPFARHFLCFSIALFNKAKVYRSRIHERSISLRFLGIILRVIRVEISVYNVYFTNQFQTTFAWGWGGGGDKICQ